ncbi:MAG: DUF4139 domain-containing protein [Lachnospiraceae bacterium]|nr:DUF4139 domain-containing protein [Lachnospiraceae bacterium]
MNLNRCENGHFYDTDKFSECPHCGPKDRVTIHEDVSLSDYKPVIRPTFEQYYEPIVEENMIGSFVDNHEAVSINYSEILNSKNVYEIKVNKLSIYNKETVIEARIKIKPYKKYDYLYIIGLPEIYDENSLSILSAKFDYDSITHIKYKKDEIIKKSDEYKKLENIYLTEKANKMLIEAQMKNILSFMKNRAKESDSFENYTVEVEKCKKKFTELTEESIKSERIIDELEKQEKDILDDVVHMGGVRLRMIDDSVEDVEITIKFTTDKIFWTPEYVLNTYSKENVAVASLMAKICVNMNYDINDAVVSIISGADNAKYVPKVYKYVLKHEFIPETLPVENREITGLKDFVFNSSINVPSEAKDSYVRQNQIVDETTVNPAYMSYNSSKPHLQIVDEDNFIKRTEYRLSNKLSLKGNENVSITVLKEKMDINKKYIAMPSKSSSVYIWIECDKIMDFFEYDAKVNIFYDEKRVDTKYTYGIDKNVGITLGTTHNVNVSRKIKASDSRYVNMKKNKQLMTEYAIKVENKRDEEVELTVLDNIPVTDEDEVSIDIVKDSGANLDEKTGICSWEVLIPADEEKELEVEYIITYPASLNVIREW